MLSDFEQQVANVLGARLLAPFQGRVGVAGNSPAGPGPLISVAVTSAQPLDSDLGNVRPETVPGATDARRVLKLACSLEIAVTPASTEGRVQQMQGVDAVLYAMDAPDVRSGQALIPADDDPGFSIDEILLSQAGVALDPTLDTAPPVAVSYAVKGWFWPIGTPGATGPMIEELRLFGALLPLTFDPATPSVVAGGSGIPIRITVGQAGSMSVTNGGVQPVAVADLALQLSGPGGKNGAGVLSNTSPGTGTVQLAALMNGVATVTYTPPAVAATDMLIVSTNDGTGGAGGELGRLTIKVTG
jgi:hypothetical protein